MFVHAVPQFHKGRILKLDMLESLRDYPRHLVDIYLRDYADGILAGAEVLVREDELIVQRGIVKHNGLLYVLNEDVKLTYDTAGKLIVLKLRFLDTSMHQDFLYGATELVLDEDVTLHDNEMELGRFKLKAGARLRSDYQSFADLATEYNTFNLIHVPYAAHGASTLHPYIIRYFAAEMMKLGSTHIHDVAFVMQCFGSGIVERELLLYYIDQRLGYGYRSYPNDQIHKWLTRILDEAKGGNRMGRDFRSNGKQRIMVD